MARHSVLNDRHRALGANLDEESWNGMPIPLRYSRSPHDEVIAVRTRAGLYDVSALNIINISGPDAEQVIDRLVAVDVTAMTDGESRLAAALGDEGSICDDIMVIRYKSDTFRLSHGSGATPENLAMLAQGKNVTIVPDHDVHILSLQGPKSLAVLAPHTNFELSALPYFEHKRAQVFGYDVYVARGGYSGELGYEVYCTAKDAVAIWDNILEAGREVNVIAASWDSLELARVEACLLFFPYDMPEGDTTPWEVNMAWGVDVNKKGDYLGKQAVLRLRGRERVKHVGVICNSNMAVDSGDKLFKDGQEVGIVTTASFSEYLMQSIAMVHIKPEFSQIGTQVAVQGSQTCSAQVVQTPFYDPGRLRTHPEQYQRQSLYTGGLDNIMAV